MGTEELPSTKKGKMAGGNLNEPTTTAQIILSRQQFEREVVRGDRPPHYLDTERYEKETNKRWKIFELPYSAGHCIVSWAEDLENFGSTVWNFSYTT